MLIPIVFLGLALQQNADSIVARAKESIRPLTDSVSLKQNGFMPLAFGPVRDLTPFQGQHWLHPVRIATNAPTQLSQPTFVMYLPVRDSLIPVGVAYSTRIGPNAPVPKSLAGMPAEWHTHVFCRNVPGEGRVLADGVEDCKDRGGTPTPQQIAMVHTWTIPNPDGPNAHDNPSLPFIAVGLKPSAQPTHDDRLFGVALGETYGAKLPEAHRIDREAAITGTAAILQQHRSTLRALVPVLIAAQNAGDHAKFDAFRKKAISAWSSLLSSYHALASTPEISKRLDLELEMVTMTGHHH